MPFVEGKGSFLTRETRPKPSVWFVSMQRLWIHLFRFIATYRYERMGRHLVVSSRFCKVHLKRQLRATSWFKHGRIQRKQPLYSGESHGWKNTWPKEIWHMRHSLSVMLHFWEVVMMSFLFFRTNRRPATNFPSVFWYPPLSNEVPLEVSAETTKSDPWPIFPHRTAGVTTSGAGRHGTEKGTRKGGTRSGSPW